jgi:hypothetical protein
MTDGAKPKPSNRNDAWLGYAIFGNQILQLQLSVMTPATSRQDDGARNSRQSPHLWPSRGDSLKPTQA